MTIWVFPFSDPVVLGQIRRKYGSNAAFFEALDIDFVQSFPELCPCDVGERWGKYTLDEALSLEFGDPTDTSRGYDRLKADLESFGRAGYAVLANVTGVMEQANMFLGIEETLMNMALAPEKMAELFDRLGRWGARNAEACLELGADVVHVSDDWGQNNSLMMSPGAWRRMIEPADARIIRAARNRGAPVTLHCDGFFEPVIGNLVALGVSAAHPVQESAGMDHERFQRQWGDRIGLYGGLDISYVLPRGSFEEIEAHVRRAFRVNKQHRRYLFSTAHMVQSDTALDRVEFAYEIARRQREYC